MHNVYDLLGNGKKAFFELSRHDRFMHAFWLLGPFLSLDRKDTWRRIYLDSCPYVFD